MTLDQLFQQTEASLNQLVDGFVEEIRKFRTDRAHPSLVDGLLVEAYDQQMPLNQLAAIVVPEAKLIQIKPFDTNNLEAIVTAIRANDQLGLNPTDDGQVVYLPVPPLTTERRQQLIKNLGRAQEAYLVRLRYHRHEALKTLKGLGESTSQEHLFKGRLENLCGRVKDQIQQIVDDKRQELVG